MVYLPLSVAFLRSSEKPPKMKPDFNLTLTSSGTMMSIPPKRVKALMTVSLSNLACFKFNLAPPKTAARLEPWKTSSLYVLSEPEKMAIWESIVLPSFSVSAIFFATSWSFLLWKRDLIMRVRPAMTRKTARMTFQATS